MTLENITAAIPVVTDATTSVAGIFMEPPFVIIPAAFCIVVGFAIVRKFFRVPK